MEGAGAICGTGSVSDLPAGVRLFQQIARAHEDLYRICDDGAGRSRSRTAGALYYFAAC